MPGRQWNNGNYRYGFNGKEMDNDVSGAGAQYDYGFRIYDPRVVRFLSVDPLFKSYPWFTPYQFAGNMPIAAIDLDGLESKVVTNWITIGLDGKTTLQVTTKDYPEGVVGPLGKGTLTEYVIDSRIENEDYGKKSSPLSKIVSFPKHESYALFEPDKDADKETKKRGGLFFVSKHGTGAGSGPEGELAPGDGQPINVDLLIEAAGGYREMTPWEGGEKLPFLKRLAEVLENLQRATEGLKKGDEIREKINEVLEKKAVEGGTAEELPIGSDSCTVEGAMGPAGTLTNHDFVTQTKVPHVIPKKPEKAPDKTPKKDTTSKNKSKG